MKLSINTEWLRRKAEQEDGCCISVGGFLVNKADCIDCKESFDINDLLQVFEGLHCKTCWSKHFIGCNERGIVLRDSDQLPLDPLLRSEVVARAVFHERRRLLWAIEKTEKSWECEPNEAVRSAVLTAFSVFKSRITHAGLTRNEALSLTQHHSPTSSTDPTAAPTRVSEPHL